MSGLPTPSRSPNSPPTNITISPDSTTSRTYRLTETPSNISTIEGHEQEPQAPVASSLTASQPYAPNQAPQSNVKRPPSADPQEESLSMTLAKRPRRITTALKQEESQERTSPSSESQDPENENSDTKGKEVEQRPPDSAPVKKKWIRSPISQDFKQ